MTQPDARAGATSPVQRFVASAPMPLALIAQRARNAKSGDATLEHATRCLGEATAALAAAYWLGRARKAAGDRSAALRERVTGLLGKGASIGGWVGLLRESASAAGGEHLGRLLEPVEGAELLEALAATLEPELREDGPFGSVAASLRDELHRARRGGVLGYLDFLAAFRNRAYGHASVLPESVCRRLARPFLEATCHILGHRPLFDGCWLGRPGVSVLAEGDGRHWKRLVGLDAQFLEPATGLPSPADADPRFLYFVGPGEMTSLSFLVAQDEDETGLSRFGFFQRAIGKRGRGGAPGESIRSIEYLDYVGVPFRSDAAAGELAGWLGEQATADTEEAGPTRSDERRFGDFVIEHELGRGAMGIVYRARQASLGRTVALKVLPPALATDPVTMGRFHREGTVLARCDHPNVVRILAHGIEEGRPWYAMEFVEGADLSRVFSTLTGWSGRLGALSAGHLSAASSRGGTARPVEAADASPPAPAEPPAELTDRGSIFKAWARLFAGAAEGVAEINRRGVIHRDLKPANLMLTARGDRLVVMDLGLAKPVEASQALTRHAADPFVGSARYAAPEQIQAGLVPVDFRADIYGLGATLYEMVTLSSVYDCTTLEDLLRQKLLQGRDPVPPRRRDPRIPEDLEVIIRKATAREPGERYAKAEDFAADLQAFVEDRPIAARPPGRSYYLRMFYRRNRALVRVAAAALVALVAVVAGSFLLVQGQRDRAVRAEAVARDEQAKAVEARGVAEGNRARAEELAQFMLFDLKERLEPLGRLDLLGTVARRAVEYYESFAAESETDAAARNRAVALGNVGEVLRAQGDYAGALDAFRSARLISERLLSRDPSNADWVSDLFLTWRRIGDVLKFQGELANALEAYRAGLAVVERAAERDAGRPDWQQDLAQAQHRMAEVFEKQGELAAALGAHRKAVAYREALAARDPGSAEWQSALASSQDKLGDALRAQGQRALALEAYRTGVAIRERLTGRNPTDAEAQRGLSIGRNRVGELLMELGDLDGALAAFRGALTIRVRLAAQDPDNAELQRNLGVSHDNIGDVLLARGDVPGALEAFRAAESVAEQLSRRDPTNAGWQRNLCLRRDKLGNALLAGGDLEGALAAHRSALELALRLAELDGGSALSLAHVYRGRIGVGDTLLAQGATAQALESYAAALETSERMIVVEPSNAAWRREGAAARHKIGDAWAAQGDLGAAAAAHRAGLEVAEELARQDGENAERRAAVAYSCWRLARTLGTDPATRSEADQLLSRARELLEPLEAAGQLSGEQRRWLEAVREELRPDTLPEPSGPSDATSEAGRGTDSPTPASPPLGNSTPAASTSPLVAAPPIGHNSIQ